MSEKKRNYPFALTDSRNGAHYNVVFSSLWQIDGTDIILPKSAPKHYAYAYNVFREGDGWIGGGSFIIMDHRPTDQDAMSALGIVLQHEANAKATEEVEAQDETSASDEGEVVKTDEAEAEAEAVAVAGETAAV
jgi:hypothetical protein